MTTIPLGVGAYKRAYGQEPEVVLLNRFFEEDPSNQVESLALLARPGDTAFVAAGAGPIRWMGSQDGTFDNDLFFVSGEQLYRYDGTNTPIAISGTITSGGTPSVTFVAGAAYEHLFIADGTLLQYYDGEAAATGTLTVSGGNIVTTDTVEIGGVYYEWTSGSVDTGSPAGTLANPWLVDLGADDTEALANMVLALNATGTEGTTYSTGLTAHTTVEGVTSDDTTMDVAARTRGTAGNSITTTETGTNIAWGASTLEGGGAQTLNGVATPDDVGIVSLTTLASFVLCAVSQSQRFYWIYPAEVTIDALDFAEAESEPDELIELRRVGDRVYMLGQSSTEVWYASGDDTDPFLRQQGLAFSQGTLEGTTVDIRSQVFTIAEDGIVYEISGSPQRISNSGIEEQIRLSREAQS